MPCSQVVGHLTTTLGLQRGALFDVKTIPDVDVREYERVMHGLEQAGFRMTPGIHVGFLTAPKHRHPSPAE